MKAAIYCRLSKEDEDAARRKPGRASESIQNQKSMLIQYARDNGYEIYGIYCDEDYSGVDRDRPDFNRLLEAASRRRFDVVLAKTQSRFTRDMELVERYLHGKFVEWGIRFIAVVDHADTDDAANKKSRQINGLINEWYLEDLSGNVRAVLEHKRRQGQYIAAHALYGYQKDPADKNRLVVDPEAAAVVRRIFALYLAGNGPVRIARVLNGEGVPSPAQYRRGQGEAGLAGEGLWSKATISQMLRNRTYAGDLEQGRHKRVSYKSKKTVWLPRQQWIVVPNTHEPIIGRESFDCVQRMLAQRGRQSGGGQVHPLAGKVYCGLCGGAMEQTGSGSRPANGPRRRYYRCRQHQRDAARCAGQSYLPAEPLEALVQQRLRWLAGRYFDPAKCTAKPPGPHGGAAGGQTEEQLRRLRGAVQRRRSAARELYLDKSSGLVSAEQFAEWSRAYGEEIAALEQRIARLEQQPKPEAQAGPQPPAAEITLTRQLACTFVDSIWVYPPDPAAAARRIVIQWKV